MHKEIEKIKKLEGSPIVIKNLFSKEEINKFLDDQDNQVNNESSNDQAMPHMNDSDNPELYSPLSVGEPAEGAGDIDIDNIDVNTINCITNELEQFGHHVSEVYSPPRVTKFANEV